MNQIKKHIPNAVTSINALCGCIAIVFAFKSNWDLVLLFTFLALIADFLDGFVARILKVSSQIGAELDSLADAITFGVLPGMVVFQIMMESNNTGFQFYPFIAFLIPVFSIIRLAKFNVDTEQTYGFKGIPTPANAAFFISLPFFSSFTEVKMNNGILIGVIFIMCWLMVSDVKLIALKFKNYSIVENWDKYLLIILSVTALIIFQKMAFIVIVPVYVTISIIANYTIKK